MPKFFRIAQQQSEVLVSADQCVIGSEPCYTSSAMGDGVKANPSGEREQEQPTMMTLWIAAAQSPARQWAFYQGEARHIEAFKKVLYDFVLNDRDRPKAKDRRAGVLDTEALWQAIQNYRGQGTVDKQRPLFADDEDNASSIVLSHGAEHKRGFGMEDGKEIASQDSLYPARPKAKADKAQGGELSLDNLFEKP